MPEIPPAPDAAAAPHAAAAPAPPPPAPAAEKPARTPRAPKNKASEPDVDHGDRDVKFTDDTNHRGRVITMVVGNSDHTLTREQVLPAHATDNEVDAAKERLMKALDGE